MSIRTIKKEAKELTAANGHIIGKWDRMITIGGEYSGCSCGLGVWIDIDQNIQGTALRRVCLLTLPKKK